MSTTNLESSLTDEAVLQASGHAEPDYRMFGFIVFLLSESVIFLSFFIGYIVFKTAATDWLPLGVEGLDVRETAINTGSYFLYGQAVEWSGLEFGITDGLFGGTFYLLTGFHGLHVLTGVLLQLIMLGRSFIPGNYDGGEFGVAATSLFWHFVDVIWIVLFLLIYIWQ